MDRNYLSIEKKVVMMPTLVIDDILEIEVVVPTKHKFINGKYLPIEFKEGIKYSPQYRVVRMPKLITI